MDGHLGGDTWRSGLEGVVAAETILSQVDGGAGRLVIRGHRLEDIVGRHSFEWLASVLWAGLVEPELDEEGLRRQLGIAREASFAELSPRLAAASALPPVEALRLLIAGVPDTAPDVGLRLVADVAGGLAGVLRIASGSEPVPPDRKLGHAADMLWMLRGAPAASEEIVSFETYLISAMDHGLNASTFTARVVASTQAGLASAVTAALCALKGPLHGGAPGPVLDMLDAIGAPENVEPWVDAAVARGERLMGFGHRIYRVRDPRSEVVKAALQGLNRDAGRIRFAEAIEAAALSVLARRKPDRPLETNLEFYTALLLEALGIPRSGFTGIFAAARVVGWIAHALEQQATNRLIRPQSRYVGPMAN